MQTEDVTKPYILLTSAGRTGTMSLGSIMSRMIDDCYSVHEPDAISVRRPKEWLPKMKEHGILKMTYGRFSSRYSVYCLNVARQSGRLMDETVIERLRSLRHPLLSRVRQSIYCEANGEFNGLVDLLPRAFPNIRIAFIIRDPREWVRSWMNKPNGHFGPLDVKAKLLRMRLAAAHFADDPWRSRWPAMSQFEKLCWTWSHVNSFAARLQTEAMRIFRYEDLFLGTAREQTFSMMLDFLCRFPNGFRARCTCRPELLETKMHSTTSARCPHWTNWSRDHIRILDEHCGALMRQYDYGMEREWRERVEAAGGHVRALS